MSKVDDNGTVRDMNETELANLAQIQAEAKAQAKADADRQTLKEATLAKLGLTADEVAALLS
jgi:adenosylcobinamide amidohydrolase